MNQNTNHRLQLTACSNAIKKTTFLALIFLCSIPLLYAQYPYYSVHGNDGGAYSESIVRRYNDNDIIVYYKNPYTGNGYLSRVDIFSGSKYSVHLDYNFIGYDMSITNDTIFLCGSLGSDTSHRCCIVIMHIADFFSSSATVTYYEPSFWMKSVIRKIASYKDDESGIKLACVGEFYYNYAQNTPFPWTVFPPAYNYTYYDPVTHPTCTVNYAMAMTIPSPGYYIQTRLFRMINPFEHPDERLHDVVVTNNYVAFIGFDYGNPRSITLHACPKTNNSSQTPISQNFASDAFGNYTSYVLNNGGSPLYIATALRGDSIAIATTSESASGTHDDIWLRTFELNSMQMTHAQRIPNENSTKLKDMAYLLDTCKVEILYNGSQANYNYVDLFCSVNPYNTATTYTAPLKTLNNEEYYTSIDMLKGEYFVSTGGDFGIVECASHQIFQCPKPLKIDIKKTNVLPGASLQFDYDQAYPHPWMTTVEKTPQHSLIQVDCLKNISND